MADKRSRNFLELCHVRHTRERERERELHDFIKIFPSLLTYHRIKMPSYYRNSLRDLIHQSVKQLIVLWTSLGILLSIFLSRNQITY